MDVSSKILALKQIQFSVIKYKIFGKESQPLIRKVSTVKEKVCCLFNKVSTAT